MLSTLCTVGFHLEFENSDEMVKMIKAKKETLVKLIAETIKEDKPLDNLFSTSLLLLKQEFPKFSEGNVASEILKLLCYCPNELVLGDEKDNDKKGKRAY